MKKEITAAVAKHTDYYKKSFDNLEKNFGENAGYQRLILAGNMKSAADYWHKHLVDIHSQTTADNDQVAGKAARLLSDHWPGHDMDRDAIERYVSKHLEDTVAKIYQSYADICAHAGISLEKIETPKETPDPELTEHSATIGQPQTRQGTGGPSP